jgi:hypothetical protein
MGKCYTKLDDVTHHMPETRVLPRHLSPVACVYCRRKTPIDMCSQREELSGNRVRIEGVAWTPGARQHMLLPTRMSGNEKLPFSTIVVLSNKSVRGNTSTVTTTPASHRPSYAHSDSFTYRRTVLPNIRVTIQLLPFLASPFLFPLC